MMEKQFERYLLLIGIIFILSLTFVSAANYVNETDGFSTLSAGSDNSYGVTRNGSDIWTVDYTDDFVYHFDADGVNQTDGFSVIPAGASNTPSITTNDSDFWVWDDTDNFLYHFDAEGTNITDGFITVGVDESDGLDTNGSDFWVMNLGNDNVYHYDADGVDLGDGFSTNAAGASNVFGLAISGSDIWVNDYTDDFIYHFNSSGDNQTDGFSYIPFAITDPVGITMENLDFWFIDKTADFVYHLTYEEVHFNSVTYNSTAYEATSESFVVNVTYNSSDYTSISSDLVYNGTNYAGTKTGTGNTVIFTKSLVIPIVTAKGNISFYWEVNLTNSSGIYQFNSSSYNQMVSIINFSLCDASNNFSYLNFTFQNEDDSSIENATLDTSTFYHWLDSRTVNRTATFTSTVELANYTFCFTPQDKSVNLDYVLQYSSTGYPQRRYSKIETLSNSTTHRILYLLATADGLYSAYTVQNINGQVIEGVSVIAERLIGGTWTLIEQSLTDDSGTVTFWLNPDYDHRITFTKTGYTSQQVTIRPSQSTYTVTLVAAEGEEATYNSTVEGISWTISPKPGWFLDEDTNYLFEFNITASLGNLLFYSINISDINDNQLGSSSGTNAYGGNISVTVNTGQNKTLYGRYYVNVGDGVVQIDPSIWSVQNVTASGTSFYDFIQELKNYETNIEDNYTMLFFLFLSIFLILAVFTRFTGMELSQPGINLALVMMFVLVFSFAGFFTIDFVPNDFINKYGIALVASLYAIGFYIGRLRQS